MFRTKWVLLGYLDTFCNFFSISLLTFENPKSFKDADIGRCQTQKSSLFQTPLVTTPFSPTSLLQPQSSTTVSHVIKKTSALTVSGLARTSAQYATPFVNKFDEIANVLPLDSKVGWFSFTWILFLG